MKPASALICPLRGRSVASLPEERVRVRLIKAMLAMGFPKSGLSIETGLARMPHLKNMCLNLPQRRADLVCFATGIHPSEPLYPLLLIECKGVPLTLNMRRQVIGYNYFLKAHFIALVNQSEAWLGWQSEAGYCWQAGFPSYSQLLQLRKLLEK